MSLLSGSLFAAGLVCLIVAIIFNVMITQYNDPGKSKVLKKHNSKDKCNKFAASTPGNSNKCGVWNEATKLCYEGKKMNGKCQIPPKQNRANWTVTFVFYGLAALFMFFALLAQIRRNKSMF